MPGGRGVIRKGAPADLVVYDYERLDVLPAEVPHDLPGGEWRRVQRAAGYRYVLVKGEFLTRGGDISGFPAFVGEIGHGTVLGIPLPFLIFAGCAVWWHVLLGRAPLGFSIYMVGSNIEATRYSGVDTRRVLTLIYTLSGLMCTIAGLVMLTRFNSVRVGHGEAYLLITVLACFLGGVDPFGGFGRTASVVLALVILQVISSGLNLLGANQHLATALWGSFLVVVMVARFVVLRLRAGPNPGA